MKPTSATKRSNLAAIVLLFGLVIAITAALSVSRSANVLNGEATTNSEASESERSEATDVPSIAEVSAAGHTAITEVTTTSFADQVLSSKVPVLVDFYADWCAVCRHQSPILAKFAEATNTVKVVQVNTEESEELAGRYQIKSLPTLLAFKDGDVVARYVGLAGEEQLKELIAD